MEITTLLPKLQGVRKSGDGWTARCPAHDDKSPSLSVSNGKAGIVLHCHAGCTPEAVCASLGLATKDLFKTNGHEHPNGSPAKIVATYDYQGPDGKLLFQVCRYSPKTFKQRRPDATKPGEWLWNVDGVKRVLYRLPEVMKAKSAGKPVCIVEGEKDADCLAKHGFTTTTGSGGAGKWKPDYSETLAGCDCIIIADKDKAGRDHAQQVAASLSGKAKSVRCLELPDFNGKPVKDSADFFNAGATVEDFIAQIDTAPGWTPPAVEASEPDGEGFDKITSDLRGDILRILTDEKANTTAQRREICGRVLVALHRVGMFYFHADLKDFDSALFFNRYTKRLERIRADSFLSWLSDWTCTNRADAVFKFIIAAVETEALNETRSNGIIPESFWASRPGAVFISCGDGQAVRITAAGIETVDNGTDGVLFYAGKTCAPWQLTGPQEMFQTCTIFRDLHATAGHATDLLRAWIYSLPTNPKCKPPLLLVGEVQSGKTALAKAISQFYGIPPAISKVEEMTESNFWPCVNDGGIYTLDNADTKTGWLADTVAAAATDGSSRRRKLYCDAETVILKPRAWLILTSSNPTFGGDSGLSDRLLVCRMERRDSDNSDSALADEIAANRSAGLSHLAQTIHRALADAGPTPGGLNQRHPDFATFAVRIGRAIGRETEMIAALKTAEADKSQFCLENDFVGSALLSALADGQTFTGTANELRAKLIESDTEISTLAENSKFSAKRLGKRLAALWPHMKKQLATAKHETGRGRIVTYTLKSRPSGECGEFQTVL